MAEVYDICKLKAYVMQVTFFYPAARIRLREGDTISYKVAR